MMKNLRTHSLAVSSWGELQHSWRRGRAFPLHMYFIEAAPKQIAVLLATSPFLSPERKQPKDKETLPFQLTFLLSLNSHYCSTPA